MCEGTGFIDLGSSADQGILENGWIEKAQSSWSDDSIQLSCETNGIATTMFASIHQIAGIERMDRLLVIGMEAMENGTDQRKIGPA